MKIQFDMPPASAQQSNGVAVKYAAARRNVPRWRWYLLLVLVILPPAYFAARFAMAFWWETAPALVQIERAVVRAGVAGWVAAVPKEGERIEQGQRLFTIQPSAAPAPEPTAATPPPPRATDPTLAVRREAAQGAVDLAQRQLALREQRLAVMRRLLDRGAATRGEQETALAQVLAAQAELARARTELAALDAEAAAAPPTTAAAAAPAAPMPQAGGEPQGPRAPLAGDVLRVFVRPGEWVNRETDVAIVQSDAPAHVRAFVEAGRSRYAEVGRKATLRFFDGGRVPAEVVAVEQEAARLPPERVAPLSPRSQSIVVTLRPLQPLAAQHRIHQLPLDVRFEHLW